MKHLFFTLCATVVTVTLLYHFFPTSSHVVTVVPINGAGFPVTYLTCFAGLSVIAYWRMLSAK